MATLSWIGPNGREELPLRGPARIGRAAGSEIRLADAAVSTIHARILPEGDRWVIEDSGSTNGTFLNGGRCTRAVLHDRDGIQVGEVVLTFRAEAPGLASTLIWEKGARGRIDAGGPVEGVPDLKDVFLETSSGVRTVHRLAVPPSPEPTAGEDPARIERRLRASGEISRATAATLDLPEVLDRVVGALFGIFGGADRVFILLADPSTREITAAASRRRAPGDDDRIEISHTALAQAMERREAVLCQDALDDVRYSGVRSVLDYEIRSMMIAPLIFQGDVKGAIYVDTRRVAAEFTEADLDLLSVACAQVAACLANAELHAKVVAAERLAAVGQTVAGLTHCVKNVLQGLKGGTYIVDRGLREGREEDLRRGWELVKRGNLFLEDLVLDLLSFSKERAPRYECADLAAVCREVCELSAPRGQACGVSLRVEAEEGMPAVAIDVAGIRRSLLNLVANAVDACADRGGSVVVRIRAALQDGFLRIIVEDDGCGMSEETRAKLFAMFFSTKGGRGTGLGLAVAQKIVREHGGRIEVESREGEGTTFTILLPPGPPERGSGGR